ncbi:hypothetical protein DEO72_LG11g1549 [Vigna unguiculata]|uniref:Uncharacterized protein n=1 Tax=Vigna unguiculata TaxID=3917 RepID=A0A4D6NLM6_VIGUN|nr:hypothetical protein DEO72_LG11g1549 [Vigna unguiculata]
MAQFSPFSLVSFLVTSSPSLVLHLHFVHGHFVHLFLRFPATVPPSSRKRGYHCIAPSSIVIRFLRSQVPNCNIVL